MKINNIANIHGLRFEQRWRVDNGEDSYVIPYPFTKPFNMVFHGEKEFKYGHYGIHLGQEDRLTFLGSSNQKFKAYFIDCREDSPTKGNRHSMEIKPSSEWTLCIPPGIAHAFDGLENITTINSYELYLPNPEKWLAGKTDWNIESDVINLPIDVSDEKVEYFEANREQASEVFYELIREHQRENIPKLNHEYPLTEDIELEDGTSHRLLFKKKIEKKSTQPESEGIEGIDGLCWERHMVLWSGEHSGFVPFLDESPYYVVDHGEKGYNHDAFGIHLGQQDRLTFIGASNKEVFIELVDCREGSSTLHNKVAFKFNPSPLRYLVIPNGVAHRFENLESVFTINRPRIYSDNENEYKSGNDVIDWDINNQNYPKFKVSKNAVSKSFYSEQAKAQKELILNPPVHSTPVVILTKDDDGNDIRVALRKKIE